MPPRSAALTVRHHDAGLLLTVRPTSGGPAPEGRSRRGAVSAVAAALALAATLALLLTGAYVAPVAGEGPCPQRASVSAYAGGRQLLIRAEPARGATTLLHLCAGRALGPVRAWKLGLAGGDSVQPVAVQRLSGRVALAAAPLVTGRPNVLSVAVVPEAGQPLSFTARVAAG